jgi:hypothetical protein
MLLSLGIQLSEGQARLLNNPEGGLAIAVWALLDPTHSDHDCHVIHPDSDGGLVRIGVPMQVYHPTTSLSWVGQLDEFLDAELEDSWREFPSFIGDIDTPLDAMGNFPSDGEQLRVVRAWNAAPADEDRVERFRMAGIEAIGEESKILAEYFEIDAWYDPYDPDDKARAEALQVELRSTGILDADNGFMAYPVIHPFAEYLNAEDAAFWNSLSHSAHRASAQAGVGWDPKSWASNYTSGRSYDTWY